MTPLLSPENLVTLYRDVLVFSFEDYFEVPSESACGLEGSAGACDASELGVPGGA